MIDEVDFCFSKRDGGRGGGYFVLTVIFFADSENRPVMSFILYMLSSSSQEVENIYAGCRNDDDWPMDAPTDIFVIFFLFKSVLPGVG